MLNRIGQNLNRPSGSHRLVCAGMLCLYLFCCLATPVTAVTSVVKSGCQCGSSAQASGTCCCLKKTLANQQRKQSGCCQTTPASVDSVVETPACCVVKSEPVALPACCQGGNDQTEPSSESPEQNDSVCDQVTESCSCGPDTQFGLIANVEPRVPASAVVAPRQTLLGYLPVEHSWIFQGRAICPEAPPPRTYCC